MFTGIIDHCGTIAHIESIPSGLAISIKHSFQDIEIGESIACDGICLTVTQNSPALMICQLSPETLKLTTAIDFTVGKKINLERAFQPHTRLGGHFVMGHVDQVARVSTIQEINDFREIQINYSDPSAQKWIIPKGSIAVNGVSLTINEINEDGFRVMLVPHTLERTNLMQLRTNDKVNVEFDLLAKIVVRQLEISKA